MKAKSKAPVFVLIFALLALGVCATVCVATEETTITGRVWGQAWDDKYEVTAATISTLDGEEYWIVDNLVGKELFKLDLQKVKATGLLGKIDDGKKAITVSRYEIVQGLQEKSN